MSFFSIFDNKEKDLFRPSPGEIQSLNALKFICALMVVAIHIDFIFSAYIFFIYRIAVPIFFFITGYFLPNKKGVITEEKLKKSISKIFKITITVNLIYYCYFVIQGKGWKIDILNILLGDSQLCVALWYLNALLFSLIFTWVLVKFKLTRLFPIFIILGLTLNLLIGKYSIFNPCRIWLVDEFGEPNLFFLSRNFVTIGLPCIYLGFLVRLKEREINLSRILLITMSLLLLLFIEDFIHGDFIGTQYRGDILFLTVPFAMSVFLLFLKLNERFQFQTISQLGKKHSLFIYLYHILSCSILALIFTSIGINAKLNVYILLPCTILFTILAAIIWDKFKSAKIFNRKSLQIQ